LRRALEGVDCVLHQAALPSVTLSIADPYTVNHVNLVGTLRLLVAAREAGVKRVVFASTCAVYGDESSMPHQENTPSRPKSPYAVSKLAAEYYCQVFNSAYGLETVALRYFNVFGPRQDPDQEYAGVISKFMAVMLRGESPVIYGDGLQSRDFIYIDNVVAANFLALASPNMIGRAFNVATGARYSLLDLVATLNEILGTHIEPIFAATRSGDIKHSQADIRLIQQYGYQVRVDFRAGLEKTIAWHKARIAQDQLMHRSRSSVTTV